MEVIAKARYVRVSPRKVRLVIDVVRGMPVSRAIPQLTFMKKAAAIPVLKVIQSAVANAVHNFDLDADDLRIRAITADGGPVLHRWRARAMGRAAPIKKRTSHITVILSDGKAETAKAKDAKAEPVKKTAAKKVVKTAKKPAKAKKA